MRIVPAWENVSEGGNCSPEEDIKRFPYLGDQVPDTFGWTGWRYIPLLQIPWSSAGGYIPVWLWGMLVEGDPDEEELTLLLMDVNLLNR